MHRRASRALLGLLTIFELMSLLQALEAQTGVKTYFPLVCRRHALESRTSGDHVTFLTRVTLLARLPASLFLFSHRINFSALPLLLPLALPLPLGLRPLVCPRHFLCEGVLSI